MLKRLVLCYLLRRHWVKFGTFPYCTRCGAHVRRRVETEAHDSGRCGGEAGGCRFYPCRSTR